MVSKLYTYVEASLGPDANCDYIVPFYTAIEALDNAHNIIKPLHDYPPELPASQKKAAVDMVLASVTLVDGGLQLRKSSVQRAGNGVFAATEIQEDKLIYFNDKPLLRCPNLEDGVLKCCGWCCRMDDLNMKKANGMISRSPAVPRTILMDCPKCKKAVYCSSACQKLAWEAGHMILCGPLSKLKSDPEPEMMLTAQLLYGVDKGLITDTHRQMFEFMGNERWLGTDSLLPGGDPHYGDIKKRSELLQKMSKTKQGTYEIMECFGRVATNFKIVDTAYGGQCVAVLDILTGLINHNCEPNVHLIWEKGRLEARSLKPIKAGEELFLSYVNPFDWALRRQIELMKAHHFICYCAKCAREELPEEDGGLPGAQQAKRWATLDTLHRTWHKLQVTSSKKTLKSADYQKQLKQIEDTAGRKFPRTLEPMPSIYQDMVAWFIGIGDEYMALKMAVKAFVAFKQLRNMRYIYMLKMLAYHLLCHPKLSLRTLCECRKSKCKSHICIDISKPPMNDDFGKDKVSISIVAYGYALFLSQEAEYVLGASNNSQAALKSPALECMAGTMGLFAPSDENFLQRFRLAQEKMLKWADVPVTEGIQLEPLVEKLRLESEVGGKDSIKNKIQECMEELGMFGMSEKAES